MSFNTLPPLKAMASKLGRQSSLTMAEIAALGNIAHQKATVLPHEYLMRAGDRPSSFMVLLEGWTFRSKVAVSGARQILGLQMPGDWVNLEGGLLEAVDDNVQALTIGKVAHITRAALDAIIAEHPSIARALWRDTQIESATQREWMLNLGKRSVRQRIAHLISETAKRQDMALMSVDPDYVWPLNQEQVADATGLTGVHVNRTMTRMKCDRLYHTGRGSLTILDRPRLHYEGEFDGSYLREPSYRQRTLSAA